MIKTSHTDFRRRIKSFFDNDLPPALESVKGTLDRARAWRMALADAGLAGLDYPVEMGGAGAGPELLAIWREESYGLVPREESVFGIGVGMALPTLREHAPELARRFVPPGLRGEEIWCQLYSEPGAGSDLAALSTVAVRDGDEWVISGQKVWTSGAQHSQLGILLARTDRAAAKHQGITMFVLPMEQAGVTVRPLRQMTGEVEFNEVFLDEARLPADWCVGEVNEGWRMAVALLAHERVSTGTASIGGSDGDRSKIGRTPLPLRQLRELAIQAQRASDPVARQQLSEIHTGEQIMSLLGQRRVHPSIGKLWRTTQGRNAAHLAATLRFPASPGWVEDDHDARFWNHHILNCRGMSIGGGTDEIQRNTLGERHLGLPKEPKFQGWPDQPE